MLDTALAFASANQVVVLVTIAVLVVLIVTAMGVAIVRAGRIQAAPPPEATDTLDLVAVPVAEQRNVEVRTTAKAVGQVLREGLASCRDRYSRNPYLMPWVLRLGGHDDGGMAMAVNAVQPPVGGPERDGLSWTYGENGVLIEVADTGVLDAVLGFARRTRPALPIDGIIVTVPITELIDQQTASAYGTKVYNLLWQVQRQLGFTIPVYFVVTGAEELEGLRAFEAILPAGLREGMIGWSFPYPMETVFSPQHVGEMVQTIDKGVLSVIFEAFGSVVEPSLGMLLVRTREEVHTMAQPLSAFMAAALRRTAFQESHYFRGVYLTVRPDHSAAPSFAADLLEKKIFAENGLPKPLRGFNRTHLLRRIAWPAALAAAVLAAVLSLWISVVRLDNYKVIAAPILRATSADIDAINNRPVRGDKGDAANVDAAIRYLRSATILDESEPLLFVPISWVADDPYGVRAAMRAGWRKIVMRSIKQMIEESLVQLGKTRPGPDQTLASFLVKVAEAEAFAKVYNRMGRGDGEVPVREVLQYALKVPVNSATVAKLESWGAVGKGAEPIDDPNLRIDLSAYSAAARTALRELADDYFRYLAAGGQAGARLAIVAAELDAIGAGRRDGSNAETSFSEIWVGLEDAARLLERGKPTWLGADQPVIPNDVALLLQAASLSELLGQSIKDDFNLLAARRYDEVKDRVGIIRSVIGPLVTRNTDGSATLSAEAETLRQTLGRWLNRDFMKRQVVLPGRAASQGWDAALLETAPPIIDEYMVFDVKDLAAAPAALRPAMRATAQRRLQGVIEQITDAAAAPSGIVDIANAPPQLREWARSLRMASPVLERLIESFQQIGMRHAADRLRDRVSSTANGVFRQLDRIVDEDQLYIPSKAYLSEWRGGPLVSHALFDHSSQAALSRGLATARATVSTLARDVAAPVLEVLARPVVHLPRDGSAQRWSAVLAALDQYEGARPNSSLMLLEKFIRDEVPKVTETTCPVDTVDPSAELDFFAERLENVKQHIRQRCVMLADELLRTGYEHIAGVFNERLAGRQPFAQAKTSGLLAVDPADVRQFYAVFDARTKDVVEPILRYYRDRHEWREATSFLDRMLAARTVLTQTAQGGTLAVVPRFRVERAREIGASDIIEWTLRAGERSRSSTGQRGSLQWRPGEPVILELRWAKDGPAVPTEPLGGLADGTHDLVARFRAEGQWALIDFIRDKEIPVREKETLRDSTKMLQFDIRTRRKAATAQPIPLTGGQEAGGVLTASRGFAILELRVVREIDGKVVEEPAALPELPERAPRIAGHGASLPGPMKYDPTRLPPWARPGAGREPTSSDRDLFGLNATVDAARNGGKNAR